MTDSNLLSPAAQVRPQLVTSRRMAREIALKAAYAREMRDGSLEEVLLDPLVNDGSLPPAFTVRLLTHMDLHLEHLDEVIKAKVQRWEFHRIAVLDRLVLRLGTAELLYFPDVPPKVTINEAIEIAKAYSTDNSGRFVNGVLDAIFTDLTQGRLPGNEGVKTSN